MDQPVSNDLPLRVIDMPNQLSFVPQDPDLFVQNELKIWRLLNDHVHIVPFLGVTTIEQWPGGYVPPLVVCRYYQEGSSRQVKRLFIIPLNQYS